MPPEKTTLKSALASWWREQARASDKRTRVARLAKTFAEFVRDSLPDRKRQRFGDAGYDWDFRVDTTSANVGWRDRFIGLLNSSYQPIEADIFREMMNALPIDFRQFTFIDIGSGKGRALLLASEFSFQRILGIELLPRLHQIAQENIVKFCSSKQDLPPIESIRGDAADLVLPDNPLVIFIFHSLPEEGFRKVLGNVEASLAQKPRSVFVVYANPVFEILLASSKKLHKVDGTSRWVIYQAEHCRA